MKAPRASTWWIVVPLGLLLVVALLLLLVDLFDRRLIADPLTSRIEEQTGRALRIGSFDLHWGWPLSLHAEDVTFANAEWGSHTPMLRVSAVSVRVHPLDLLDGPPYAQLHLQDPLVLVERSREGEWNWMIETGPSETEEMPRVPVSIEASGGKVVYQDGGSLAIGMQHFSLIPEEGPEGTQDLVVTLRATHGGVPLAIDGRVSGNEESWSGNATLRAGESTLQSRFSIDTDSEPVRLSASIDSARLVPARLAELKPANDEPRETQDTSLPRLDGIDAELAITVATMRLPELDVEDIRGQLTIKDGHVQLSDFNAHIGNAALEGTLDVDTTEQEPAVRVTANLARMPLSSLPDSLPLSAQPGEIAAQVNAWLELPDRQLPFTLPMLVSNLAVPQSRLLYAPEKGEAIIARLQVMPAGSEPSVSMELRGLETPPFSATLTGPPLARLVSGAEYPLELALNTEGAQARIAAGLGELLRDDGISFRISASGSELPALPAFGFVPPPVAEFSVSGDLQEEAGRWTAREVELAYGATQLSGSVVYEPDGDRRTLAVDMTGPVLDLTAIPQESAREPGQNADERTQRWIAPDVAERLHATDARVDLSVERMIVTDDYRMQNVTFSAQLDQGRLQVDPMVLGVAGGTVRGSLSAQDLRSPVEGRLSLDVEDLQPGQLTDSLLALEEQVGRVSGELHLAFAEASPGQTTDGVLPTVAELSLNDTRLRFRKPDANRELVLRVPRGTYAHNRVSLHNFAARIADSDLRGDLALDLSPETPAVTAALHSNEMKVDDVRGVLNGDKNGPHDGSGGNDVESADVFPEQPFDFAFLRRATADIEYTADDMDAAGIPLGRVAAKIRLQEGHLLAEPVSMETANGNSTLRLDMHTRQSRLQGLVDFEARGLHLSEMLSGLDIASDSFGIVGGQGKFWVSGESVASVIGSADGGLMLLMTGGQLDSLLVEVAGLDIGEAALAAAGLYNPARIDCAYASLYSTGGFVDIDQFIIDTNDTTFYLNGTVDLGEETLDLALFPEAKDPSFPTTDSPLAFQGTLKQPEVGLVGGELAARTLGAVALAALAGPVAAALPFIEPGLQDEPVECKGWVEKLQSASEDES